MTRLMTYKQYEKMQHSTRYFFIDSVLRDADGKLYTGEQKNIDMLDLDEKKYETLTRKDGKGLVIENSNSATQEDLSLIK